MLFQRAEPLATPYSAGRMAGLPRSAQAGVEASDTAGMRTLSFAALLLGVILIPTAVGLAKLDHDQ